MESLLEPCRPGAGTGQELFDLNDLLGNEVSFLQADAMCRYNVDISMDLSSKILHVRGRRTHFSQVFQNIIHNACEAMAGSKDRHLKISTRMHAQVISIKFADTGPGINSDILPHMFTPFFSSKKKASDGDSGNGLGFIYLQTDSGSLSGNDLCRKQKIRRHFGDNKHLNA